MFRISLNKLNLILFLLLLSQTVCGQGKRLRIVDDRGEPILHAYARWGGSETRGVDASGFVMLPPLSSPDGGIIEFVAMGYEPATIDFSRIMELESIALKERIGELGEVVVSATRTTRSVADLPMPVQVLSRKQIEATGGMRLSEVLSEQTGLQIVADHGNGLQMQGLSSDYILILLDGEPMIGRTAGTFDLDRLSTAQIERIEILRGPSSAIYGSEAMAGVINIITKKSSLPFSASMDTRHRSFGTWDLTAEAAGNANGWHFSGLLNRFSTEGFDLTPETPGNTQSPFAAYTAQLRTSKKWGNRLEAGMNTRLYTEESTDIMQANRAGTPEVLNMLGQRNELNIQPSISYRPHDFLAIHLRGMTNRFNTMMQNTWESDGGFFDQQDFEQWFHRTELQADYQLDKNHLLSLGIGHQWETVEATRYDGKNRFDMMYAFAQHQWSPGTRWQVVTGLRADRHTTFGNRISPKLSVQYTWSDAFSLQASVGAGFKTPDFRQMLLNFNNAAAGYFVFGSLLAQEGLSRLQSSGQIAQVLIPAEQIGALNPESSRSINLGARWLPHPRILGNVNLFFNSIDNLIETAPVARLTTGQNAFSYFNVARVQTRGAELDLRYRYSSSWEFSAGYAWLDTEDLDVMARIDAGQLFKRNAQNRTVRVTKADYGGLFNRSRHSGNIKATWISPQKDWNVSLRGIYRGRFGFGDINGNLILDDDREYAPGIFNLNLRVSKQLSKGIEAEVGAFNILEQVTIFQPNNPGRTFFAGLRIPFHELTKSQNNN